MAPPPRSRRGLRTIELLPARLQRQDHAIALPDGSALREPINRLLPQKVQVGRLGDPTRSEELRSGG